MAETALDIRVDPFPGRGDYVALFEAAWGRPAGDRLPRWDISLVHLGAYDGDELVGYVNVATDGAAHAFLLDPMVHPRYRHHGVGRTLVGRATNLARDRGADWLHVDYSPQLESFYRACGFNPTSAGLIRLV